jgi:hypothetical protein
VFGCSRAYIRITSSAAGGGRTKTPRLDEAGLAPSLASLVLVVVALVVVALVA